MQLVSRSFSIYLNNVYNYQTCITRWGNIFRNTLDTLRDNQYIGLDFNSYPYYPNNYKYINDISKYNSLKIDNSSTDAVKTLVDQIPSEGINLKYKLDKYPISLSKLKFESDFQTTYFTSIDELYPSKYFLNNNEYVEYDNLLYEILGTEFSSAISNSEITFTQLYTLFHYFIHIFPKLSNLTLQITNRIVNTNSFSNSLLRSSFEGSITDLNTNNVISTDIINIISNTTYLMLKSSNLIKTNLHNVVNLTLPELSNKFTNYLEDININHSVEVSKSIINTLQHSIATKVIFDSVQPNSNFFQITYDTDNEDVIISGFIKHIKHYNIRSYMYLAYIYKFFPFKFLNVLSEITKLYIESVIITPDLIYLSEKEIEDKLESTLSDEFLNYTTLENYISTNLLDFNSNLALKDWISEKQPVQFGCYLYLIDLLDKFIESSQFQSYIEYLLHSIREYLLTNGYISNTFVWYKHTDEIKLYFKTLFRTSIIDKSFVNTSNPTEQSLFSTQLYDSYSTVISMLSNSSQQVVDQFTGTGFTRHFVTTHQFSNIPIITIDGVIVTNFNHDGVNKFISFNRDSIPLLNSVILVTYDMKYQVNINNNVNYLKHLAVEAMDDPALLASTHNMIKNIYLSVVTKQTFFNILDYYSYEAGISPPPVNEGQIYNLLDQPIFDSYGQPIVISNILPPVDKQLYTLLSQPIIDTYNQPVCVL